MVRTLEMLSEKYNETIRGGGPDPNIQTELLFIIARETRQIKQLLLNCLNEDKGKVLDE